MTTMKENLNIVLCGFMGCGKTTVGRRLAAFTGRNFIDTDAYIEKKAGLTVSEIFSKYGEAYFRELEHKCVSEIAQNANCIIATGGGTVLNNENALALKSNGSLFFLDVPFETIFSRISNSNRPLVKALSKDKLEILFEARRSAYLDCADFVVEAKQTVEMVCGHILISVTTQTGIT